MKVGILIGSTREGRVTPKVAKWVAKAVDKQDDLEAVTIDLNDFDLPFFNEDISPQYNPNRKPEPKVKKFLDKIAEVNALVIVTPEYNRSYSAVLKNALDFLDYQLNRKPVLLVAHGSTGGAQAVAHLRGVVPGVNGVSLPKAVMVNFSHLGDIDEEGNLSKELAENPYGPGAALSAAVEDLAWYTKALNA